MKKEKISLPMPSGAWTNTDPGFEVKAKLKRNKTLSILMPEEEKEKYRSAGKSLPDFYEVLGVYKNREICIEDNRLFDISINIVLDDLRSLVGAHGIDKVLAACERSLNSYVSSAGEKLLGDVAIVELVSDNSDRQDPNARFLSCIAKTNKGDIKRFMGVDGGKLRVF